MFHSQLSDSLHFHKHTTTPLITDAVLNAADSNKTVSPSTKITAALVKTHGVCVCVCVLASFICSLICLSVSLTQGSLMLLAFPLLVMMAVFTSQWMRPALKNGWWFQVGRGEGGGGGGGGGGRGGECDRGREGGGGGGV